MSKIIRDRFFLPYNPALNERAKNLRNNMTRSEKKMWFEYLKSFPCKVLRQKIIDNYIVDFYIPRLKLIIEIDGETHFTDDGMENDMIRTAIIESYGLHLIRFTNTEVMNNFNSVCSYIDQYKI